MLSRLPITLDQLKAGNNSEKLKNEIRQLLASQLIFRCFFSVFVVVVVVVFFVLLFLVI